MESLDAFLAALRPLLVEQKAQRAYLFGSHARGAADRWSDIDLVIIAPSARPPVERFRDYLPAIVGAGVGVDLFVYTPEEFERMRAEERPFLLSVLKDARSIYEG